MKINERYNDKNRKVSSNDEVYSMLKPLVEKSPDVETIYFVFLNPQNQVISIDKFFSGTVNEATYYPREVVKRAIELKATAAVMAHNHPSGNLEPSKNDRAATIRIHWVLDLIGINLYDHIVIGDGYQVVNVPV